MTTSFPDLGAPPSSAGRITLWPLPELPRTRLPAAPPRGEEPDAEALAYARGWAEGEAAARSEGDRQVRAAVALLEGAAADLTQARAALAREFSENLHALSLAIARHLILREVAADPEIMRTLVARAMELAPGSGSIRVHLHPDDLTALAPWRTEFSSAARSIDWAADAEAERGSCRVETPQRLIEGRLDHSLIALFDRLRHV